MSKEVFSKDELRRQIQRERRAKANQRCKELKVQIALARRARAQAIKTIALDCRARRVQLTKDCQVRTQDARVDALRELAEQRQAYERLSAEELRERRAIARSEGRGRGPGVRRARAPVRQTESDDEVRQNLSAELRPVFDVVRKQIKAVPGKVTRTEAFLEWAEAHPAAVYEVAQAEADRELASMIAEHERERAIAVQRGPLKREAFRGQF